MKKFFATILFVLVFAFYALNQYFTSASSLTYAATATATASQPASQSAPVTIASAAPPPSGVQTSNTSSNTSGSSAPPTPTPTPAQKPTPTPTPAPTPAPAPAPKPTGQYVDGTYTGSSVDVYYGYVQVQATVSGGRLANVTFLSYPSDRSTSRMINAQAMPYLTQQALQVQSANVDGVSGASETTRGFQISLAAALSQAKS